MPDLATWNTRPRTIPTLDAGDWRDEAACIDMGDLFFPDGEGPASRSRIEAAKSVCATCPVAMACLDAAMAEEGALNAPSRYGIRGGTTPTERASLSRSRRRVKTPKPPKPPKPPKQKAETKRVHARRPADCPEPSEDGFQAHRAKGERVCAACLAEHLAYEREVEDQQRPADCAKPCHATRDGHYKRGELACRACLDWHAARTRAARQRKREEAGEAA